MKKGFTIIEIMVTVSIVALFSTVVFSSLGGARARSRDSVRVGDVKSLSLAAENYFVENGSFPANIGELDQYFIEGASGSAPRDPQSAAAYSFIKLEHGYCVGAVMETSVESPSEADDDCPSEMGNYIIKGP